MGCFSSNFQPCSSGKTSLADDVLSFDTSYASVFKMEYTLNRACLLEADAIANVKLRLKVHSL